MDTNNSLEIENILNRWFTGFVRKYKKFSPQFRYEYSRAKGVYLVSYDIQIDISSQEYTSLAMDIMAFSDMLQIMYDSSSPLFTEKGELFSLSKGARVVK